MTTIFVIICHTLYKKEAFLHLGKLLGNSKNYLNKPSTIYAIKNLYTLK